MDKTSYTEEAQYDDDSESALWYWSKFTIGTAVWIAVLFFVLSYITDRQIGIVLFAIVFLGQILLMILRQMFSHQEIQLHVLQVNIRALQKRTKPDDHKLLSTISDADRSFFRARGEEYAYFLIKSSILQIIYVVVFLFYVL